MRLESRLLMRICYVCILITQIQTGSLFIVWSLTLIQGRMDEFFKVVFEISL